MYLARRGRGAAVLSTALNSNAINVIAGLLLPASLAGLGPRSGQGVLVAAWYAGLTVAYTKVTSTDSTSPANLRSSDRTA